VAEWGLASLLLGVALMVMAPVTLLVSLLLWTGGRPVPEDFRGLAVMGGLAALGALVALGVASLAFGVRALVVAGRTGRPTGLAWGGALASAVALVLWLVVGTDLVMVLHGLF
jgi:hypothetical protein